MPNPESLNILMVSTFEKKGGAAKAMQRLVKALKKENVTVKIIYVMGDRRSLSFLKQYHFYLNFLMDRIRTFLSLMDRSFLYQFSLGKYGVNIMNHPFTRTADIVHVHWAQFGFLSTQGMAKLFRHKPVLWTLHDMWAFTGGCHYAYDCEGFKTDCDGCYLMKSTTKGGPKMTILDKKKHWQSEAFKVVTPSQWMAHQARSSTVLSTNDIVCIGNPIDTEVFQPMDGKKLRKKWEIPAEGIVVLVGAMDLEDSRKGFQFLLDAINLLRSEHEDKIHFVSFGKSSSAQESDVINLGFISDEQALGEIYNTSDLFILPSVQDNLPNMVVEAMACGVPAVTFKSGGVLDLVIHEETGLVADAFSARDLSDQISRLIIDSQLRKRLSINSRQHIVEFYREEVVAKRYLELYQNF